MTRRMNARVAGVAYLLYIGVAFPAMVISSRATAGSDIAARLATMAQHAFYVRLAAVLSLIGCFCALVLAVTLYAITRVQDRDLAMIGLTCRVAEGVTGGTGLAATLALLSSLNAAGSEALGAFVYADTVFVAATFFAVGSTIFSWLLLRGRMIPAWLAWVGVVGSALAALAMPLEALHLLRSAAAQLVWAPVAVFEVVVALWFIVKGVRELEVAHAQ
jgi:hypothetical protein